MIQLNLLPSIKAEYVSAQRTKRTVTSVAVLASAIAIGIVGLLSIVAFGSQQIQLNNLEDKIKAQENAVKQEKDLDKVLTIQNQLLALTPLHDSKPVMSRLFTYMQQTTPADVKISSYKLDNSGYTLAVTGKTPNIELINKYVDTLKFTEIGPLQDGAEGEKAFSEVVLASFEKAEDGYSYSLTLKFSDKLFSSQNPDITLVVPNITTTRSQTQLPSADIFAPTTTKETQ